MFEGTHGNILVPFIILTQRKLSFSCNLYDFLPFCNVFDCLCTQEDICYTRKVQNYLTSFSNNYLYNIFSLKFNLFGSMFIYINIVLQPTCNLITYFTYCTVWTNQIYTDDHMYWSLFFNQRRTVVAVLINRRNKKEK